MGWMTAEVSKGGEGFVEVVTVTLIGELVSSICEFVSAIQDSGPSEDAQYKQSLLPPWSSAGTSPQPPDTDVRSQIVRS